ncbi:MAG: hypothetical protein ACPLSM_06945 [Thermosphaera sp.]
MDARSRGSIPLGVAAGFAVHVLLGGFMPVVGDLLAGFVAGYLARGAG